MGDRPVYQVDPKRYHTDDILAEGAGSFEPFIIISLR